MWRKPCTSILVTTASIGHSVEVKSLKKLHFSCNLFGKTPVNTSFITNVAAAVCVKELPLLGLFHARQASTSASQQTEETHLKDFSEIPGPKPWPIIKNVPQLVMILKDVGSSHIHLMFDKIIDKYGPIAKFSIPAYPPMVMTTNPDDIEVAFKTTMNNPLRTNFASLKRIRQNNKNNYFNKKTGLLTENGEEWWRLRSRFQGPLLKPKNVAMYLPMVDTATIKFMDRIDLLQEQHDGRVPDNFIEELYKWSFECIGTVALDRELGCLAPDLTADSPQAQMIKHVRTMFAALQKTEMESGATLFKSKGYKQLEEAHDAFLEIADKSIQDAARSLREAQSKGDPNRQLTVMETFLNTEGLSQTDVTTMILDMLFAGVDTTSNTLGFAMHALASNPDCQQKLQAEIDTVLGDDDKLKPQHISKMTYLERVLKETLRLYPVGPATARVMSEDVVLSGYRVPAGMLVVNLHLYICQSDKHFKRASEFLPDRWSRERPYGCIHPYASLPFSTGTRMCIGKRIAQQEIYAFLIRALQKYTIQLTSDAPMDVISQFVLKPSIPLNFRFCPRN